MAESFADGLVTTAKNPIYYFAFAHRIEIIYGEIITEHHGLEDIGNKLRKGAIIIAMEDCKVFKNSLGEFFCDFQVAKTKFFDAVFIVEDGDILGETLNLVDSPSIVNEVAIAKRIF